MNTFRNWVLLGLIVCLGAPTAQVENPEKNPASKPALPQFIVAGHEREMRLLGDRYKPVVNLLHANRRPDPWHCLFVVARHAASPSDSGPIRQSPADPTKAASHDG